MSFWDTSTLAKLYLPEIDSPRFLQHAAETQAPPKVARLAVMEMQRVARAKEANGELQRGAAAAVLQDFAEEVARGNVAIVEFGAAIEREFERVMQTCYAQRPPLLLRTADAIHLGSARVARETEIVSTDRLMRAAATILGFTLFPSP